MVSSRKRFSFILSKNLNGDKIELDRDITKGMEINTSSLFTDNSNYDLSNDGSMIAFNAHNREYAGSWTTGWKKYFIDYN